MAKYKIQIGDNMSFQTEFEFELPRGYVDQNGEVHRHGVMRLATAADEIMPLRDPRVQQNPGYLTVILLSRVVTKLGTLQAINNRVIENLFTIDMAYKVVCPHCNKEFDLPLDFLEK